VAQLNQTRVEFLLPDDEDDDLPVGSEMCWCDDLGDRLYRIDNIPLYIEGVSLGDVVEAEEDERGIPQFTRIVELGGHATVRLIMARKRDRDPARRRFIKMGCKVTNGYGNLVAIDVPQSVDTCALLTTLEEGAAHGRWVFEPEPVEELRATIDPPAR
jgi:hypothetical protein